MKSSSRSKYVIHLAELKHRTGMAKAKRTYWVKQVAKATICSKPRDHNLGKSCL